MPRSLRPAGIAVLAVVLRLWVSQLGYNYDIESWRITADLALSHQSVYAHTERWNYGPVLIYPLAGLRWLSFHLGSGTIQSFHFYVALLLSIVDLAIALLLWRNYGRMPALFFLFNPISILITGYHSQIDNVALLLGLGGWILLIKAEGSVRMQYGSAALLGLSLGTKHVLAMLPVFLLGLKPELLSIPRRVVYAAISGGVGAASFAVYMLAFPESFAGIRANMIEYRGSVFYGKGLIGQIWSLAVIPLRHLHPGAAWDRFPTLIWAACVAGLTFWMARRLPQLTFPVYLVTLTLLSPAIADQYLVIPLIACAILPFDGRSMIYVAVTTFFLVVVSTFNVGVPLQVRDVIPPQVLHFFPRALCQLALLPLLGRLVLTAYRVRPLAVEVP